MRLNHFLFLLCVLCVLGCGDGKITVSGSINYEGEIPERGTIAFIGDGGAGVTYGEPYTNGQYSVRLPEGKYRVRITGRKFIPLDKPIPGQMGGPPITKREQIIVPEEYGLHSQLEVEVGKSSKKCDFDLKKPEPKQK